MIFNIEFDERALKEWHKMDEAVKAQFKKKLNKLRHNPYIESARLHGGLSNCFKIKHRSSGFRLVYQVLDEEIVIFVIAIGKREKNRIYQLSEKRLSVK